MESTDVEDVGGLRVQARLRLNDLDEYRLPVDGAEAGRYGSRSDYSLHWVQATS
jgi:hypothetical protein